MCCCSSCTVSRAVEKVLYLPVVASVGYNPDSYAVAVGRWSWDSSVVRSKRSCFLGNKETIEEYLLLLFLLLVTTPGKSSYFAQSGVFGCVMKSWFCRGQKLHVHVKKKKCSSALLSIGLQPGMQNCLWFEWTAGAHLLAVSSKAGGTLTKLEPAECR